MIRRPMRARRLAPSQLLSLSILGLITIGTLLLWLPAAGAPGRPLPLVNALFTAVSAVCVTGLIVVDTANDLSLFGQLVVLLLIQLGGLGYMTLTTVVAAALGKRITVQERLTLQEALNIHSLEGLIRFAGTVFKMTLVFEAAGFVVLALRWWPEFGPGRAAWLGLFHAVSGFNNAGFSLFATNMSAYRGDAIVSLTLVLLVVCGGLGFLVLSELRGLRRRVALSLHTRFVLVLSAVLIAGGMLAILALERGNPATLGPLAWSEALLVSSFHAVMPRTAGFNTIDVGSLHAPTQFLLMVLMFIGAAPGGTGGGVKVSTFGITVVALWATVRGSNEPAIFRRRLPPELVARAFFISLIAFLALNVVAGALLVSEGRALLPTLFETTSAFGTVGLSMGEGDVISLSGHFSPGGRLLVALMMFMGRVGPLTLAVALAGRRARTPLRYPEGKVLIG
jgi:trk system potassium uptake protein TrkH